MRQLIIAFAEKTLAQSLSQIFRGNGLPVCCVAATGSQALGHASREPFGGLVVCPAYLPDMPAQELQKLLPESYDLLVLATSGQQTAIRGNGIFTLVYPFSRTLVVDSARRILETRQMLPEEGRHLAEYKNISGQKRTGRDQALIDQAKALLMGKRRLSEQEAHRYLQKRSMESGIRMAELAGQIISSGGEK